MVSSLQPPPKPIVGADLAGRLSTTAPCHQSPSGSCVGMGRGCWGQWGRQEGRRCARGWGLGWGGSFRHSQARGGHGNPALFSAPKFVSAEQTLLGFTQENSFSFCACLKTQGMHNAMTKYGPSSTSAVGVKTFRRLLLQLRWK